MPARYFELPTRLSVVIKVSASYDLVVLLLAYQDVEPRWPYSGKPHALRYPQAVCTAILIL